MCVQSQHVLLYSGFMSIYGYGRDDDTTRLKKMHLICFLCVFVLIWLKVMVIHNIHILSFWLHLWCEARLLWCSRTVQSSVHLSINAMMSFPWIPSSCQCRWLYGCTLQIFVLMYSSVYLFKRYLAAEDPNCIPSMFFPPLKIY